MEKQQQQNKAHLTNKLINEFPDLESMMFKNKNAQQNHKRKKQYKQFKKK